jgi:hypothetical protein
MTERAGEVRHIDWKSAFPWVRLFRSFRMAIDLRMLLLGSIALVVLAAGDAVFWQLPFAPMRTTAAVNLWDEPVYPLNNPLNLPNAFLQNPRDQIARASANWGVVLRPARTLIDPAVTILQAQASWPAKAFAWTRLLWALCVWGVFAGAMTRIVAVEHARETRVTLVAAVKFSLENFLSYMTATLLPVAGIGVFWILCVIGGLIGRIPGAGPTILGVLWGLELAFGFLMTLILIGAAAGWPLMYATVSTEASDGFDGFSRAYSYVYGRPWHYAWFGIVAMVYGAVVTTFVAVAASLVTYLAAAGVASGMGVTNASGLLLGSSAAVGGPALLTGSASGVVGVGTLLVGIWLEIVALLVAGFITSYFWTSNTIIYFLLRYVDDATDFHEVFLADEKATDDLLPLVGIAASEQPIVERPAYGDAAVGSNAPPEAHAPGLRPHVEPLSGGNGPTEFEPKGPTI